MNLVWTMTSLGYGIRALDIGASGALAQLCRGCRNLSAEPTAPVRQKLPLPN